MRNTSRKLSRSPVSKGNMAYVKYIAGLILFGLNGIVSSQIQIPSMDIVLLRTLFGSLFLGIIFLCTGKKRRDNRRSTVPETSGDSETEKAGTVGKGKQWLFVALSGISMGLSWIFLYEAYVRIGVGLSSITYYCGPVIVMCLTPLVFRKRITGFQKICFLGVFAGVLLVSLPDLMGGSGMDGFGLLCGFASALLHALMVIFTMKAPDITGEKNSLVQLSVSFLTVAVFAAAGMAVGGRIQLPTGKEEWFWMLFLGIVNTGIGCYLYFSDLANLPIISVSILGYLEPLSAVIFAVILLGERLSVPEIAGAILILSGALLSETGFGGRSYDKKVP